MPLVLRRVIDVPPEKSHPEEQVRVLHFRDAGLQEERVSPPVHDQIDGWAGRFTPSLVGECPWGEGRWVICVKTPFVTSVEITVEELQEHLGFALR